MISKAADGFFHPQSETELIEPFRLHWGKYQPNAAGGDPEEWTPWFRSQYANWDRFLTLRAQKDPGNVFLTDYWRQRLGVKP